MKKIITILISIIIIKGAVFSQEDKGSKHVRFGIKATPSLDWFKSEQKFTEKNGIKSGIDVGLMVEFRLTTTALLLTGLQLDFTGGKVKYKNDVSGLPSSTYLVYYYNKKDDVIAEYEPADYIVENYPTGQYDMYLLNERKYSNTYITLPLCLKLKTKEIGSMTYFGMVGINSSFLYSSKATDEVQKSNGIGLGWGITETKTKTKIGDIATFNEKLNIGAGVEWNLSGTTSLTFGINYLLGFTNLAKSESEYLRKREVNSAGIDTDGDKLKQNIKSNSIGLVIGVLF